MNRSYRKDRLGEEIKKIVSELLLRELKDPRFPDLLGISGAEAARDGSCATLYITVPAGESREAASAKEKQDVLDAFYSAKGFLRREIGARLQLRHTPDLIFKIDASQEYGRHIERLFSSLEADK
jgi:ribosome-binding factor A